MTATESTNPPTNTSDRVRSVVGNPYRTPSNPNPSDWPAVARAEDDSNHGKKKTSSTSSIVTSKTTMAPIDERLKARSTNEGRSRGKDLYEQFAREKKQPSYDELQPPKAGDFASFAKFKKTIIDFSAFMINDARQLNGQFYKPYSAKQYFSNFLNSILNEERFSGMPKPAFLEGLSETILEKCTLNARARGDVDAKQRAATAIRRHGFASMVKAGFAVAKPGDDVIPWRFG